MIYSFQQVAELLKQLSDLRLKYPNLKYSISKSINHDTTIILYNQNNAVDVADFDFSLLSKNPYPSIDLRWIGQDEYELDTAYFDEIFENKEPFEGYTRRLDNAMGKYPPIKVAGVAPVVSFYSYKGGVGRTTTLAAFASYHARSTGARVFMIDCDFEAPGFANFFGLDQQKLEQKGGVVEFLSDTINLQNTDTIDKNLMDNYVHEVSRSSAGAVSGYAGEGFIQIMLAGNLSNGATLPKNTDVEDTDIPTIDTEYHNIDSHIDHYLHGLARLDFANAAYIGQRFELLLQAIQKNYKPDVILIDSRTGFNDIFSNVVLRISDILVGFFGTSIQNVPGIYNFMDTLQRILPDENEEKTAMQKSIEVFMISAMSPNPSQSLRDFKKIITSSPFFGEKLNNAISTYAIGYQTELASIGTPQDGEGDILLNFTNPKNERYPSYSNGDDKYLLKELSIKIVEKKTVAKKEPINPSPTIAAVTKKDILEPIATFLKYQDDYASTPPTNDFINKHLYFRNYLSDLFIRDTFIVRGYKGTGKTLLYNALQNEYFVERLKHTYKITENFNFYAVIDKLTLIDTKEEQNIALENALQEVKGQYTRFWKVYMWNTLVKALNYTTEIATFDAVFTLGVTTWQNFTTRMDNTNMLIIEKELLGMNELLKKESRKVVLTFDHLDVFWSPNRWKDDDNPIASLFEFCNGNPFSHIYFKVFVRTDLYNALSGITNKNALDRRTIPLEWGNAELFSYFFKIVFSVTNDKFINWLSLHDDNVNLIREIKDILKNNNQIPTDRIDILEFLVESFFGKYYHTEFPHYGLSFDWFHSNLKNANDFISIRPFNVLIQEAIKLILERYAERNSTESTILSGRYYGDGRIREFAGKKSFDDIAGQNGYSYLKVIAEVINNDNYRAEIIPLLKLKLSESELEALLRKIDEVAITNGLRKGFAIYNEVKVMLIETGILRKYSYKRGYNNYAFAFLYKNYFKLSPKPTK
jgi:MinD-like ATPase involved in chromosome partitioning or flagellar assembly